MGAALLLQLLIARYLRFEHFDLNYLDLVLIMTVYTSFGRNPKRTIWVAAGSGLVQDSFSGGLLGTQSFTKTVIGYGASLLSEHLALDHMIPRLLVMGAAALVNGFLFIGLHALFGVRLLVQPVGQQLMHYLGWYLTANVIGAAVGFHVLDLFMQERPSRPTRLWARRYRRRRPRR